MLCGLGVRGRRGTLLMQQCATLEYGRRGLRTECPKTRSRREQLTEGCGATARIGGQLEIRQPIRNRDTDLGTAVMQIGLRLKYVRALLHECGGQAHGHRLRQLQL